MQVVIHSFSVLGHLITDLPFWIILGGWYFCYSTVYYRYIYILQCWKLTFGLALSIFVYPSKLYIKCMKSGNSSLYVEIFICLNLEWISMNPNVICWDFDILLSYIHFPLYGKFSQDVIMGSWTPSVNIDKNIILEW